MLIRFTIIIAILVHISCSREIKMEDNRENKPEITQDTIVIDTLIVEAVSQKRDIFMGSGDTIITISYVEYPSNDSNKVLAEYSKEISKGDSLLKGKYKEYHYTNGKLKREAVYLDGNRIGWEQEYYISGELRKDTRYLMVKEEEYKSGWVYYDEEGNVLADSSFYYELKIDTSYKDESYLKVQFGMLEDDYVEGIKLVFGNFDLFFSSVDSSILDTVDVVENRGEILVDKNMKVMGSLQGLVLYEDSILYMMSSN